MPELDRQRAFLLERGKMLRGIVPLERIDDEEYLVAFALNGIRIAAEKANMLKEFEQACRDGTIEEMSRAIFMKGALERAEAQAKERFWIGLGVGAVIGAFVGNQLVGRIPLF